VKGHRHFSDLASDDKPTASGETPSGGAGETDGPENGAGSETVEVSGIALPPTERVIDLFGAITEKTHHVVRRAVSRLERESDDPIIVRINTHGGYSHVAFAIHDLLTTSAVPIITAVYGNAYSAGSIILQAGNVRAVSPNSVVMIHQQRGFVAESLSAKEAEKLARDARFGEERIQSLFVGRTGHGPEDIRKWFEEETYMTALQAIERNFADAIIVPRDIKTEPIDRSAADRLKRSFASIVRGFEGISVVADFIEGMLGREECEEDEEEEGRQERRSRRLPRFRR
jgi:ATP-dependent protease ClpP protease subunit